MANSRTPSDEITKEGFGIHARRAIAYIFLILITILCLFWFYVLFVNATRTDRKSTRLNSSHFH
mgnify:CR=1 FL=1